MQKEWFLPPYNVDSDPGPLRPPDERGERPEASHRAAWRKGRRLDFFDSEPQYPRLYPRGSKLRWWEDYMSQVGERARTGPGRELPLNILLALFSGTGQKGEQTLQAEGGGVGKCSCWPLM